MTGFQTFRTRGSGVARARSPVRAFPLRRVPPGVERAVIVPADPLGRHSPRMFAPEIVRDSFSFFWTKMWVLEDRVVASPAMGAPAAVVLTEILAASGVRDILCLGSCGSLGGSLEIGDVVVAEGAFPCCGAAWMYSPDAICLATDWKAARDLERRVENAGFPVRRAVAVTTDAPFRETQAFQEHYTSLGASCVEMELAGVLAAAKVAGVRASGLFVVSDRVFPDRWERGGRDPIYRANACRLLAMIPDLEF